MEDVYHKLSFAEKRALEDLKDVLVFEFGNKQVSMWGKPLTMTTTKFEDETRDVILLKFLEAQKFSVKDAYIMLTNCLSWRKEFGIDSITDQYLGFKELEGNYYYIKGFDRKGHPVCYIDHGELIRNKNLCKKIFEVNENVKKFVKWRVQVFERGINMLSFKPGGVNSLVIVGDFSGMDFNKFNKFIFKHRAACDQFCAIIQNYYPGMISYQIFLNLPWQIRMSFSILLRCGASIWPKEKVVIAKQGRAFKALHKYIKVEYIPEKYSGLSQLNELNRYHAYETMAKGGKKSYISIKGIEANSRITWDVVVEGWDLEYCVEFVPDAVSSLVVLLEKPKKMKAKDLVVHNSYIAREDGTLVLSFNNTASSKTKLVAYRHLVQKLSMA